MFISKRRHNAVVEAYEKQIAALELENADLEDQRHELSLKALKATFGEMAAEATLERLLADLDAGKVRLP